MGTVDIVPGVSGSTVAVLLGIYERFIAALKNINKDLIVALFRPFAHKFDESSCKACSKACKDADLPWLITLFAGLATAFIVASMIIPSLMAAYPQQMRGLFLGLVLGSIITPIRQIKRFAIKNFLIIAIFAVLFFILLSHHYSAPIAIQQVTLSQASTIPELCLTTPCALQPDQIAAMPENAMPPEFNPVSDTIAAGQTFSLPTLPYLFCIFAGFVAICAMLLPGISGSFVLLTMDCYYGMLNAIKGFLHGLAHGNFLATHLLYVVCFGLGAILGVVLFSRALTWLFKHHHDMTLSAIIGILFGCLVAIWPFKNIDSLGLSHNFLPDLSTPALWPTIIATICGLAIVIAIVIVQTRLGKNDGEQPLNHGDQS